MPETFTENSIATVDHVALAAGRIVSQFEPTVSFPALVRIFANRVQEVENALFALLAIPDYQNNGGANVGGAVLDLVGSWIGEPRNGKVDATYRVYLQARIIANSSFGDIGSIDNMIGLLCSLYAPAEPSIVEDTIAAMYVNIELMPLDAFGASEFLRLLRCAKAGGVKVIMQWLEVPLADTFQVSNSGNGTIPASTGKGFDDGTGTVGGIFASASE
jgi:hypothetical protein